MWVTYTGVDLTVMVILFHSTAGAWSHQVGLLFPGTYSHTSVFPKVHVFLGVTFITSLLCLWTNEFRLTDDGRLFPSLYLQTFKRLCTNLSHNEVNQILPASNPGGILGS